VYPKLCNEHLDDKELLASIDPSHLTKLCISTGYALQIQSAAKKLCSAPTVPEERDSAVLHSLPRLSGSSKFYFFASHNWGDGGGNHARVKRIVDAFNRVDKPVWFDNERLSGHIENQISQAIDESAVFVAFITKAYVEKVSQGASRSQADWCFAEINYASMTIRNKMIAVVMEPAMKNVSQWTGLVKSCLSSTLNVDFTSDDKLEACVLDLSRKIAESSTRD